MVKKENNKLAQEETILRMTIDGIDTFYFKEALSHFRSRIVTRIGIELESTKWH